MAITGNPFVDGCGTVVGVEGPAGPAGPEGSGNSTVDNQDLLDLINDRTFGNNRWISAGDLPSVAFTVNDERGPIYDALNARPVSVVPHGDNYYFATLRITATSNNTAIADKRFYAFATKLTNAPPGVSQPPFPESLGTYYGQGSGITLSESNMKIFRFERYLLNITDGEVTGTTVNNLGDIGSTSMDSLVQRINTSGPYNASNQFVLFSFSDGTDDRFAFYTGSLDNTIGQGQVQITSNDIRFVDPEDSDKPLLSTDTPNLSYTETSLNYNYFGKPVYGVYIKIDDQQNLSDFDINHNLKIDKYLVAERRYDGLNKGFTGVQASAREDLFKLIGSNNASLKLYTNSLNIQGVALPVGTHIYLEYTKQSYIKVGIGADTIGESEIQNN